MMECSGCGKEISAGGAICPWCGILITNPQAGLAASPGRRLGSYLLDIMVSSLVIFIVARLVFGGAGVESPGLFLLGGLGALAYCVFLLILLARGKSYGKWLLGMRTYRVDGRPAGFWLMLLRETIGKFLSSLVFSLGFLWLLWDRDRQGWHDKLAGTIVIVEAKKQVT